MAKGSERKRAAHQPDCNCIVCRAVRNAAKAATVVEDKKKVEPKAKTPPVVRKKAEKPKVDIPKAPFVTRVETLLPPEVEPVRLDSLNTRDLFNLNGKRYRVGEKAADCVVCHQLSFRSNGPSPADQMWMVINTVSLSLGTMVKPIE